MAGEALFIPGFGLSPRCAEGVPAVNAAIEALRRHLEVTVFHWPSVSAGPDFPATWQAAAQAIESKLPETGHIVAIAGNVTYALLALRDGAASVRSLVCDGIDVPPATWAALGMPTLASAEEAMMAIINSPSSPLRRPGALDRFPGADVKLAGAMIDEMYADADWPYVREFVRQSNTLNLLDVDLTVSVPALYLETSQLSAPGAPERRELFQRLVPNVEFDETRPWRYDDPASGKAFAEKAITFMQKHSGRTILSTVLFGDIVDSTAQAAEMGGQRWSQVLGQFHGVVGRELNKSGGKLVDTAGDGFLAVFEDPGAAIQCAVAVAGAVPELGLETRSGAHTGQVEVSGEKYSGVAVHTAARIAGRASPGEVLVSETVRQLLAGSGLSFEERGLHELKGLPTAVRLYAAT